MSSRYGRGAERFQGRIAGVFVPLALLVTMQGASLPAQSLPATGVPIATEVRPAFFSSKNEAAGDSRLPDAPGFEAADQRTGRSLSGTVTDVNGAEVAGALVTLSSGDAGPERALRSDGNGFFSFIDIEPGTYKLTVISAGFSPWISAGIMLHEGESYDVPHIVLRIAVATTNVDVVLSRHDIAQEQVKAQEKQRVLGIFPNFFVSYVWNAVPLTAGQKFGLAFRDAIDPEAFVGAAFGAGLTMALKDYPGYGNGAQGFFVRTAALYGDGFNAAIISEGIMPALLHQDPRYFYKGTGSKRSRALYAISAVVICRGDNGRSQPNYSFVLGNLAAAGISNAYYPPADRGAVLTIENTLIGFAASAVGDVFQEFFLKHISTGVKP